MKRGALSTDDLKYLGQLVTHAFGLPLGHLHWKQGAPIVAEARRLFCLYLYVVEGMPYKRISKFLSIHPYGARMLLRHLARRDPFPYTDLMQKLKDDFHAYLKATHDEWKAESTMDGGPDIGPAEAPEAHVGAP